jgi:uncharacterized protein involved in tellurium resistance
MCRLIYIRRREIREIEMAKRDADGMIRVDLEWTIEGRQGTKAGKLYGLHEQEVAQTKVSLKQRARRGDTITIREI